MPTLLVTKKMSPELAARVQASVEGHRAQPGVKVTPRIRAALRITAFATIVVCCLYFAFSLRRFQRETEGQRAGLISDLRYQASQLTPQEHALPDRLMPWFVRLSGPYPEDHVADALKLPGALDTTLQRPMVYVRGALANFESSGTVKESARSSFVDAFVLCLMTPPAKRSEQRLRKKARAALFADSKDMQRTRHVARLYDAYIGLPLLSDKWQRRVQEAPSQRELGKLRQKFDSTPIEATKRAARAKLLLVVMDEPGDRSAPAELDGERAHNMRVGLVDLTTQVLLLRLRRKVDPSWLSASSRAEFARGIDSCAFAMEVHSAVQKKDEPEPEGDGGPGEEARE